MLIDFVTNTAAKFLYFILQMELHKLLIEGENGFYMAATHFQNEEFDTLLVDFANNAAFSTKLSRDIIQESAKLLGKEEKDITEWAKKAFSLEGDEFSFKIDDEILVWKKSGKRKLRIAEIPIKSIDVVEAHKTIFEHSVKTIKHEKQESTTFKHNFDKISEERKGYQTEMKKMIEYKNNLEQKLYSNFQPILHSKQDRIKKLEQKLKNGGNNADSSDSDVEIVESAKHTISSSEDEMKTDNNELNEKMSSTLNLDDSQNFLNL